MGEFTGTGFGRVLKVVVVLQALVYPCSAFQALTEYTISDVKTSNNRESWEIGGYLPQDIAGYEGDAGPHPVFLWFSGTGDDYGSLAAQEFLRAMASRGFLALEVSYPSPTAQLIWYASQAYFVETMYGGITGANDPTFTGFKEKADVIIPAVMDAVCALPEADCTAGVAVSGFSQGGFMAHFAALQGDTRVTAVMPYGAACLGEGSLYARMLRDDKAPQTPRRVIIGGSDELMGGEEGPSAIQECLKSVFEMSDGDCPVGSMECLRSDGTGYLVIPDATHAMIAAMDPAAKDDVMKCELKNSDAAWGLTASMDWLASTAAPDRAIVPGPSTASECETGGDVPLTITHSREAVYMEGSIVETLYADGRFTLLLQILMEEAIEDWLAILAGYSGTGMQHLAMTFFAPTDDALNRVIKDVLGVTAEAILAIGDDTVLDILFSIVACHMVQGQVDQENPEEETITTLNYQTYVLDKQAATVSNNHDIVLRMVDYLPASNGVIIPIDGVLAVPDMLPQELPTPAPTNAPTGAPTAPPTDPPTAAPTPAPTEPPAEAPTPAEAVTTEDSESSESSNGHVGCVHVTLAVWTAFIASLLA